MKQMLLCLDKNLPNSKIKNKPQLISKDGNKIATAAAEVNFDIFSVRLPDEATIFVAEATL